jgi:hypothetical protein
VEVDVQAGTEGGGDRVAAEQPGRAEGPPQLGQRPPQRAQRVVGVGEQQLGQVTAAGRAASGR